MRQLALLLAVFGAMAPTQVAPQRLPAHVVSVTDGDTISVVIHDSQRKVRIEHIDAPEMGQPYGKVAKATLSSLVFGKDVEIEPKGADQYGRLVAVVWIADSNVGRMLVEAGFAWEAADGRDPALAELEKSARSGRRGLWRDEAPVPPWVFRRSSRPVRPSADRTPTGTNTPERSIDKAYHGNALSLVYHAPGCRDYNCKNCTVVFATREDAAKAGYRPHAQCVR